MIDGFGVKQRPSPPPAMCAVHRQFSENQTFV